MSFAVLIGTKVNFNPETPNQLHNTRIGSMGLANFLPLLGIYQFYRFV